jgi:DNA anti-recombination protein RmuC
MDQDLVAYLDQRFSSIDRRFEEIGQRFSSIDRRFEEMGQRLDTLETDVRKTWISIEDVRSQVCLVAEGVANNNEQLGLHRVEVSRRFNELEALTHNAYADLDERVRRLEATG